MVIENTQQQLPRRSRVFGFIVLLLLILLVVTYVAVSQMGQVSTPRQIFSRLGITKNISSLLRQDHQRIYKPENNIVPECLTLPRKDFFVNKMKIYAPLFAEKKYSIGVQPNLRATDPETMEMYKPSYEIAWNAGDRFAIDPRVLLVLSEMSTLALSQPEQIPEYPFKEIENSQVNDNFQMEYYAAASQLSDIQKMIAQTDRQSEYSLETEAVFYFWQKNRITENTEEENIVQFRKLFQEYFEIDPSNCRKENEL